MSKLLKCPFCGGEVELMIFNSEYETVTVRCTNEDCDITMGKAFFTDEEAIEHWNRRKPMANIVEKLKKREKYLENAMKESHENGHRFSEEKAMNERVAIRYAINIVKQEINNGLE